MHTSYIGLLAQMGKGRLFSFPQNLDNETPTKSQRTACFIHLFENTTRAVFFVYDIIYLLRNKRAAVLLKDWLMNLLRGLSLATVTSDSVVVLTPRIEFHPHDITLYTGEDKIDNLFHIPALAAATI